MTDKEAVSLLAESLTRILTELNQKFLVSIIDDTILIQFYLPSPPEYIQVDLTKIISEGEWKLVNDK
jgi:hypothetical protein